MMTATASAPLFERPLIARLQELAALDSDLLASEQNRDERARRARHHQRVWVRLTPDERAAIRAHIVKAQKLGNLPPDSHFLEHACLEAIRAALDDAAKS